MNRFRSIVRDLQSAGAGAQPGRELGLCLALCAVLSAACGGASFDRAPNSHTYRPLPLGSEVKVAASADELPGPVAFVGTLRVTTKGDPANRTEAEALFRKSAPHFGCDAVADLKSTRRETKSVQRNRTLGANGTTVYTDSVIILAEHDWTAGCLRTAEAPPDVPATTAVAVKKPVPDPGVRKPEPVRPTGKSARGGPQVEPKPEPKPEPRVEPKPEPKPEPRVEPKPEPKPEPRLEPKPEPKPVPIARPVEPPTPALDTGDPKIASEVARFFLGWSDAWVKSNVDRLCQSFDGNVDVDIQSSQPKMSIRQTFPAEAACESVRSGDLATYLRDLGPAEVHAEVATLVPTLFRIHGGAFLKLDEAAQKRYADALIKEREGKKPLSCTMYNVQPLDTMFKVSLSCAGVQSFKVVLSRTAENQFKVMQIRHIRP